MKYVTLTDIAKKTGVSKSTVSRALANDKGIKEETRKIILEAANTMGYRRNEAAISLRQQTSSTIGIIVPNVISPFYMDFATAIQTLLNKAGYKLNHRRKYK